MAELTEARMREIARDRLGISGGDESFWGNVFSWENTGKALANMGEGIVKTGELLYESAKHPIESAQALGQSVVEGFKDPVGAMEQNLTDLAQTLPGVNVATQYAAEQSALSDYSPEMQAQLEEAGATTTPAEWGQKVNEDLVNTAAAAVGGKALTAGGQVLTGRAQAAGRAINAFSKNKVLQKMAKDPESIAKNHGVGIANTAAEREFFRDLADGAGEWAKSKIAVGVKTWNDYSARINTFLKDKAKFRENLVRKASQKMQQDGVVIGGGGVKGPRHGLHVKHIDDALETQWKKLEQDNTSAYAKLAAEDRQLIQDQMAADFMDPTTGLPLSVTPDLLFDKLQTVYRKLRELRTYDDNLRGAAPRNPGQTSGAVTKIGTDQLGDFANVGIQREVLGAYAKGLKNALNDVMERAVKMYPAEFKGVRPKAFTEAGDSYHALSSYADAVERQMNVMGAVKGPGNPNSLLNAAQPGIAGQVGEVVGDITGISGYADRYRMLKAMDLPGERMADVSAMGRVAAGGVPNAVDAAMNRFGTAATLTAAKIDDLLLYEQQPEQFQASIEQSPLPDETKQQLMAAKDGTPAMQRSALGAAKIAALEAGTPMFEQSPIAGFNSYVRDAKEGGYITDMQEKMTFRDEVNRLFLRTNPAKALELTERLSEDGYIPYIPEEMKRAPVPVPPAPIPAPTPRASLMKSLGGSETKETETGKRVDPGY